MAPVDSDSTEIAWANVDVCKSQFNYKGEPLETNDIM